MPRRTIRLTPDSDGPSPCQQSTDQYKLAIVVRAASVRRSGGRTVVHETPRALSRHGALAKVTMDDKGKFEIFAAQRRVVDAGF
jgi:hypothetical protein